MGAPLNPWERRWIVVFISAPLHPLFRPFVRRRRGFSHCHALHPLNDGRWISAEWALQGLLVRPIGKQVFTRLMNVAAGRGAVLIYDVWELPRPSLLHLLPTTCAGSLRQLLALPPTWRFWTSPWDLWCELLQRGAAVVVPPVEAS